MYYYQKKYPTEGDLLIVEIESVSENGNVYVYLLEYDNIIGMISQNELSNRRLKSYKSFKVGKTEVVRVLSVDKEKGYIDLSKKSVSEDETIACKENWAKTRFVYTVMCGLGNGEKNELYETIVWPLDAKYGHAYDAFLSYLADPESVPEIKDKKDLTDLIDKKMKTKLITIRKVIDVTCFLYDGIDAIKTALKEVEEVSPEISVHYNVPSFSLVLTTTDKESGEKVLEKACEAVSRKIKEFGGMVKEL